MKHLHMLLAIIVLFIFILQALPMFMGKTPKASNTLKILNHVFYTAVILTGLGLVWQIYQVAGTQHWVLAKLILLIVAASATIKAQRHYTNASSQAKAGLMIASVAYVGIIVLAITKPTLF
ncbi:SirB2 family protein [Moraxella catarrhalis]|uniref:SirB2 family protein n=1 Tax=Moraxella catarrhalis TaxID=480 RepID=UPI0007E3DDF8|nr:SirB2 family protein [Moraxella catarrhalis]